MKNTLTLLFVIISGVAVYGQFDSLRIFRPYEPDYSKTIFPKDDGLIYNQYVGETIAGYSLANGWRKDDINGGFNKEIYGNPYVTSNGEYIYIEKKSYDTNFIFYRYEKGKKFNGKIIDTLNLTYTPPIIKGLLYGNPYYESQNIKVVFQADCINGLIQGKATVAKLYTGEVIAECYFKKGEIIGKSVSRGLHNTNHNFTITYEKGNSKPLNQKTTDEKDKKVVYKDPKDDFTLKGAYINLNDPTRLLEKKERTEQEYKIAVQSLVNSSNLKSPLGVVLHHINYIKSLKPSKEYETEHFEVKENFYEDFKIVYYKFKNNIREDIVTVTECFDKNNNLVIILFENISFDEINSLNYRDYNSFLGQFIGFNEYINNEYGNFLLTFTFDKKREITNASRFRYHSRTYSSGCTWGWIYEDFTDKINSAPKKYPITIFKTQ